MNSKALGIIVSALLLAACAREPSNSEGNGPGNADGLGGRQDPQTAPSMEGQPSSSDNSGDATSPPAQPSPPTESQPPQQR